MTFILRVCVVKYLVKNLNDTYYVRIRVCSKLIKYFRQREISKSLRTRNLKQAKALLKLIVNDYKKLKLLATIGLHSEEHIQTLTDEFVDKYTLTKYRTIYSTKTARLLTHGACLDEFEKLICQHFMIHRNKYV